jgi:putative SOS response-associated peptidase YedK
MCVRYALASKPKAIEKEFQAEFQFRFAPVFNAHVGQDLPVIAFEESKIVSMRWGLLPHWSRTPDFKYKNINAWSGDVVKHMLYRRPLRKQRCLVLANCYYLWVRLPDGKKQPHVVYFADQRLFSMAGLWDQWVDRDHGIHYRTFSILTTKANSRIMKFSKTMPVIITPSGRRKYLRPDLPLQEVTRLLRPYETDQVNLYPVSSKINDLNVDHRDLVQPVGQRLYKEYRYEPKVYLKLEGMGSMKDNPDRVPVIKKML